MKKYITLAALVSVALSVAPAIADTSAKQNKANRKLMHDYAGCVVQRHATTASDAIIANADNATITKRYFSLIDSQCMARTGGNVEMRFGGDLYRYALADALVNERLGTETFASFEDRLPLAHLAFPDKAAFDADLAKMKSKRRRIELTESYDKAVGISWLSRYGECVARDDPAKARLWLLTPPDGPEETSRINDLRSSFSRCLQDGTLTFNRTTMRGTVAINYYRLATASLAPGSKK